MKPITTIAMLILAAITTGCAASLPQQNDPVPSPETRPQAPWSASRLSRSQVAPVYFDVWNRAENRATCALLAPAQPIPEATTASSRPATFSGGWAVAYDLPSERSAFGIAGSGTGAWSPDVYDQWPHKITYSDGSTAGYGIEGGGAGNNWLAYVKIPGQQCLYNVWSRRGRSHLEQLLASLRFVSPS